jgi:hypothetical protein
MLHNLTKWNIIWVFATFGELFFLSLSLSMQTIYRLKAQEISMAFLKSLKTLFAGQEVEITIKSVKPEDKVPFRNNRRLAEMIKDSRISSPVIAPDIDIRALIDESQSPDQR